MLRSTGADLHLSALNPKPYLSAPDQTFGRGDINAMVLTIRPQTIEVSAKEGEGG